MPILSKIDKEVLISLIILIIAILFISFIVYKNMAGSVDKVQNLAGGAQTEIK